MKAHSTGIFIVVTHAFCCVVYEIEKQKETENNIIPIPQASDLDKQFLVLEDQRELIREQAKLILEKKGVKI